MYRGTDRGRSSSQRRLTTTTTLGDDPAAHLRLADAPIANDRD
jgi:hypothetical protein